MTSNSGKVGFQERPAVMLTPDANGMMHANSLASVMNMRMQQMVYERELAKSQPQRLTEAQHQNRRQRNLEHALERVRQDKIKATGIDMEPRFRFTLKKGGVMTAPSLSSPQPIFSIRNTAKEELQAKREKQIRDINYNSFLAVSLPKINMLVDEAIATSNEREKEVLGKIKGKNNFFSSLKVNSSGKKTTVSAEDWEYINSPVDDAIDNANRAMEKHGIPIRVQFRNVWDTPETRAPRLFVIYPNTALDYNDGMSTWEGMKDAIDRNGNPVIKS